MKNAGFEPPRALWVSGFQLQGKRFHGNRPVRKLPAPGCSGSRLRVRDFVVADLCRSRDREITLLVSTVRPERRIHRVGDQPRCGKQFFCRGEETGFAQLAGKVGTSHPDSDSGRVDATVRRDRRSRPPPRSWANSTSLKFVSVSSRFSGDLRSVVTEHPDFTRVVIRIEIRSAEFGNSRAAIDVSSVIDRKSEWGCSTIEVSIGPGPVCDPGRKGSRLPECSPDRSWPPF